MVIAFDSAMSLSCPLSTAPDTTKTRLLVAILRPIRKQSAPAAAASAGRASISGISGGQTSL
jgi:hypothetical protein